MDKFKKLYRVEQCVFLAFVIYQHLIDYDKRSFWSEMVNNFPVSSSHYRRDLMDAVARLTGMGSITLDEEGQYHLTDELYEYLTKTPLLEILGGQDDSLPF